MEQQKTKKKIFSAKNIISAIILLICVAILTNVIIARVKNETPKFFGYSFHIVVTDSMTPDINVGDFVVAKYKDPKDIKVGDYIVFTTENPQLNGIQIIHKVVAIDSESDGTLAFTTQGVKAGAPVDSYKAHNVIGVYSWKSAFLGKVVLTLSQPINWLIILFLVFVVLFCIKMFRKNLSEAKIEEQKEKSQIEEKLKTEILTELKSDKQINDNTIIDNNSSGNIVDNKANKTNNDNTLITTKKDKIKKSSSKKHNTKSSKK
jgi:signal peptidase I